MTKAFTRMLNDSSKLEGSKKTNLWERFKPSRIPKYNFKGLVKKKQKERLVVKLLKLDGAKRLWFENHKWTMMPSGHLMIGGRDAKGNDSIVKKHLSLEIDTFTQIYMERLRVRSEIIRDLLLMKTHPHTLVMTFRHSALLTKLRRIWMKTLLSKLQLWH